MGVVDVGGHRQHAVYPGLGSGLQDWLQGPKEGVIREMAVGVKHVVSRPHGRAQ
jgi:hypothetical protein